MHSGCSTLFCLQCMNVDSLNVLHPSMAHGDSKYFLSGIGNPDRNRKHVLSQLLCSITNNSPYVWNTHNMIQNKYILSSTQGKGNVSMNGNSNYQDCMCTYMCFYMHVDATNRFWVSFSIDFYLIFKMGSHTDPEVYYSDSMVGWQVSIESHVTTFPMLGIQNKLSHPAS